MKKILIAIVILLLSTPLWCDVSGCLESESNLQKGQLSTQFQWWIQGNFTKSFGYFGWALVSKNWSEIYPGIFWQPASWLQLGAGLGIEQNQSKPRFGAFVWAGKGKVSVLGFFEHWGSGLWWRAIGMYRLNQTFQVGLMSQHKLGIGPKVEMEFYKPFSLWVAVLAMGQNPEVTAFAGFKINF